MLLFIIINFWLQQDKRFKQLIIDTAFDGIHREFKVTLDRKSEWIAYSMTQFQWDEQVV